MKLTSLALGEPLRKRPYQLYFNCPYCDDSKGHLGVNTKKGIYHCFKCNASGRITDIEVTTDKFETRIKEFLGRLGSSKIDAQTNENIVTPVTLPTGAIYVSSDSGLPYEYLKSRHITESEIEYYDLMYCSEGVYQQRIIIPIYEDDTLAYFLGRAYMHKNPKYLNAPISKDKILFKTFEGKVEEAIICEGVFDAMRIGKYFNAISILGKKATQKQIEKILSLVTKKIYVFLDRDALVESFTLSQNLKNYRETKLVVNYKYKDPGSIGPKTLRRFIHEDILKS